MQQQQQYPDAGANMQPQQQQFHAAGSNMQRQQQQYPAAGAFNMPTPFSGPPVPPSQQYNRSQPHSGPHSSHDWQSGPQSYGPRGAKPGVIPGVNPRNPDASWGARTRAPPPRPELPPEPTEPAYKARVWYKASTEAVSVPFPPILL
jgi:hypothetical protein